MKTAAELLGGDAFGPVFEELLEVIMNVAKKAFMFKTKLKEIQEILKSNLPVLEEIRQLNKELDRSEETEKIMQVVMNGKTLVIECSKVRWYNLWRRYTYTDKLIELEQSINRFFQTDMLVQNARDTKQILVGEIRGKGGKGKIIDGPNASCAVPKPLVNPVGLEVPLKELKTELFKEDGVSNIVVLSAPPGCGKTTLAKLLCHDREVQEKFKDNIFYVIVSKNANMEGIVRALFDHKGQNYMRDFRSDEDIVYRLEIFLNNIGPTPILLVLDDVWPESKSFLENFEFEIKDLRILVTSRSVFPRFGSTYKLKPLNYEDSMTLFCNSAFLPNQSRDNILDKDVICSQIVKGCKGFPLALKVVGKSLCGEPEEIWKTRAMELSKVGSIFEYGDLLSSLQRSLDTLDKKVKDCFMDLCSFPEDQRIPVNALVDMWTELYDLDEEAYAFAKLQELCNRNLVDLVVTRNVASGCYNQHFAMQHDLLRELAIRQSNSESIELRKRLILEISGNDVPSWWMEQKQPSVGCRLLSISTDEKFSSSWRFIQGVHEVEVFVLNNVRTKNYYTLPEFMGKMEKLKVLIVTNYGFLPTELNNFLLLGSVTNLKRLRLEHVSIPPFGFSSVKLESLKKLTLYMCNIGQAFSTSTVLSEALPNLMEINIEYSNDLIELPVEICHLIKLKKLSIISCHKLVALPKEIGKLVNLEVLRLGSCIELLELPDTIGGLRNLNVLDISECLEIERLPEEIGELQSLSQLLMMGCSSNCEWPQSIMNLENLKEVVCDEETAILWEQIMLVRKNLRIKVQKEDYNLNWLYNHRL